MAGATAPLSQVASVPKLSSIPSPAAATMAAGGDYDDQTGLDLPLTGHSANAGRFPDFPSFGQLSRSGLLSVGGLVGASHGDQSAMRVYNPERISLGELDEMSLDPVIRACILGYTLILQTADLSVSCPDASMKALIESQFVPLMPQLIRETARPAMVFGWADAEIVWETRYNVAVEVDPGETTATRTPGSDADPGDQPIRVFPYVTAVKDFVPLNNTTLTLRQNVRGEFAGAVQWGWGDAFLPPAQLFHLPFGSLFRNPYGESAIKGCYPFWYWTRFLYEMLMVAVERGAAPPVVGRYPVGYRIKVGQNQNGTPAEIDAGDFMLQQLGELRSFSTAVIPRLLNKDGKDLYDIAELPLDAHVDWMMEGIAALNAQKQLYMFFPDKLLQGGDTGSYALAKEHTDLFSLAIHAKLDEILDHVNRGPLEKFVRYNDADCPPAKLTYSAPNIQAMLALSQAAIGAITTGQALVTQNQDKILVPDWKQLADQFGIPYTIVRRMDGQDAFGNPLQPGVDPDQQDHASAMAAGMAQPQGGQYGGYNAQDVPTQQQASQSGESADQYLSRVLGATPRPVSQAPLWEGVDSDASRFALALSDDDLAAGAAEMEEIAANDQRWKNLKISVRGLALAEGDMMAMAKKKFTPKQSDMMSHIYANGPTSHADLKTALPHIAWPHEVGGDLAKKGLLAKVKHPDTGAAAFQMTEAGKAALATHLGWQGGSAAATTQTDAAAPTPEAATAPISNAKANALYSLMTGGPQSAKALQSANGLHTQALPYSSEVSTLHEDGHIVPTGSQNAKGEPTFAITPKGGHALAAHMGGELSPEGLAATQQTPPAPTGAPPVESNAPAVEAKPEEASSGKSPIAGEHKEAGGTEKKPQEAYHYEPGAAPDDSAPAGNEGGPAPDQSDLEGKILAHVKQDGMAGKYAMANSLGLESDKHGQAYDAALDSLVGKGHLQHYPVAGAPGGYGITPEGAAAADAQSAEAPAPEGWDPIGGDAAKGWKSIHEGKTANVKPNAQGGFSALTADENGEITAHPDAFDTKEKAFDFANGQIGKTPTKAEEPETTPEPDPDTEATPESEPKTEPEPVTEPAATAAKPPKTPPKKLPPGQAAMLNAAHGQPSIGSWQAKQAYQKATGSIDGHDNALKKLLMSGHLAWNMGDNAGGIKITPDGEAALAQHMEATAPKPSKTPGPKKTAAKTPKAAPAPAPGDAAPTDHVTAFGKKIALSSEPTTQKDIDAVKGSPDAKLSETAKTVLQEAFDAGKLPTQDKLHQALAIAEAVNKGGSYSHTTAFSVNAGVAHGGIKALKDKADAGDSEAQAHVKNLGGTSILSGKEAATAAHQQAQEAFKNASAADLMHKKTGEAAGSNIGGFYTTKQGAKVYAKEYKNPDQAHSEHLANEIYHALGVNAPVSTVAKTDDGKTVYASQIIPNKGTLGKVGLTKESANEALKGFAADVLLGNWDAAGMGHDNMVADESGKLHRIDNGGSLLYRAKGEKKNPASLASIDEWKDFANPSVNSDYAKIFQKAGISAAYEIPGIAKQIQAIDDIAKKPGGWKAFVDQHAPDMSDADKAATVKMLDARTALLTQKRQEILDRTKLSDRPWKMADFHTLASEYAKTHAPGVTPAEKKAMAFFKGNGYISMNAELRKPNGLADAMPAMKKLVSNLDKLFARPEQTAGKDLIVSRKIQVSKENQLDHYKDLVPGDIIEDKGFGSTSMDPSEWGYKNFHMMVHIPKEAKIAMPSVVSGSGHDGEEEITLPRDHRLRVISIDAPGSGKMEGDPDGWKWAHNAHRVKVELIVPGVNDKGASGESVQVPGSSDKAA